MVVLQEGDGADRREFRYDCGPQELPAAEYMAAWRQATERWNTLPAAEGLLIFRSSHVFGQCIELIGILQRKGFTLHEVRSGRQCWVRGTEAVTDDTLTTSGTLVYLASVVADCSMQSLLREINPRMRAGWPTDEELERHAFWMVRTLSDDGIRVLGAYVAREWKRAGIKVECWPCDQHGNKTRRGA